MPQCISGICNSYHFTRGWFFTLHEFYRFMRQSNAVCSNYGEQVQFQFPNGLISFGYVKEFPSSMDEYPKNVQMKVMSCNDDDYGGRQYRYVLFPCKHVQSICLTTLCMQRRYSSQIILPGNSKIFYQNIYQF